MLLNLQLLVMLGLLTAGVHWFVARSHVMEWFWGSLPPGSATAALVDCAACSGYWLGLGVWAAGVRPLSASIPWWPVEALATGVLGLALTPVFEGVILWGLAVTAMESQVSQDDPPDKQDD